MTSPSPRKVYDYEALTDAFERIIDMIRDERSNRGLSRKQLATLSRVDQRTIQRWEKGEFPSRDERGINYILQVTDALQILRGEVRKLLPGPLRQIPGVSKGESAGASLDDILNQLKATEELLRTIWAKLDSHNGEVDACGG